MDFNNEFVKNDIKLLNLRHLAVVLSNLTFVAVGFTILMFVSQLVTAVFVGLACIFVLAFMLVATVATLGIVYLIPGFSDLWGLVSKLGDGGTNILAIISTISLAIPYVCIGSVVSGAFSILSMSFCKRYKSVTRIVFTAIFMFLSLLVAILYFVGVVK